MAGHPVAIQSPARKTRGHGLTDGGSNQVQLRTNGVGGTHFFHHGGFDQLRLRDQGKELRQFPQRQIDDLLALHLDHGLGRAHHQLDIAARLATALLRLQARFVKHPLNGCVQQDRMLQIGDLPIEPKVNAGDRRVPKAPQVQSPIARPRGFAAKLAATCSALQTPAPERWHRW